MTLQDYINELMPAVIECAELLKMSEAKYGEGIKLSEVDMLKAMTHAESHLKGEINPDGKSHRVATASRALKAVLGELRETNNDN